MLAHIVPSTQRDHSSSAVDATASTAPATAIAGRQYVRCRQNAVPPPRNTSTNTMTKTAKTSRPRQERASSRSQARAPSGDLRPK